MKHFVGGFSFGIILCWIIPRQLKPKTHEEYIGEIIAWIVWGLAFGALAWAFIP